MNVTAQPTTTKSISLDEKKKVVNYYCPPKALEKSENNIDEIAGLTEHTGSF